VKEYCSKNKVREMGERVLLLYRVWTVIFRWAPFCVDLGEHGGRGLEKELRGEEKISKQIGCIEGHRQY